VISGDSCAHNKPHPEPILCACRDLGVTPADTVYVGDAARDMQAGRAAGTATVAALFGYILDADDPATWDADHRIAHARELLTLLGLQLPAVLDV
jgi:phosphoglycolate phosphatase